MTVYPVPESSVRDAELASVASFLDEPDTQLRFLDAALHRPRIPLEEVGAPRHPGAYLAFYVGDLPCYAPISRGEYPIYVGSAAELCDRMRRHRHNTARVANLHGGRDLWVVLLPTPSDAGALFAEALLRRILRPAWNEPALRGFGSRSQGQTRYRQAPPPWAVLHPGRDVGIGPAAHTPAELQGVAIGHLAGTARPAWSPLKNSWLGSREH